MCLFVTHLQKGDKIVFLLVSADFVEGQKGKDPTRLLSSAPLLDQLLNTSKRDVDEQKHLNYDATMIKLHAMLAVVIF